MADEIINRVANSQLLTVDLEDYYPEGPRSSIDVSNWLFEGLVLREKEFRAYIKAYDWSQYQDHYVNVYCSTDAIIPSWAYMLVSLHLNDIAKTVVIGDQEILESLLYKEIIDDLNLDEFRDKPVIIKGCSNKPVPKNAYTMMAGRLKGVSKSVMYGEACSSVPLFKSSKK